MFLVLDSHQPKSSIEVGIFATSTAFTEQKRHIISAKHPFCLF
jgi:hypothetical protein